MLSNNAVGRISFEENDANAITAKNAVPPACPTVAYRSETAANKSVNIDEPRDAQRWRSELLHIVMMLHRFRSVPSQPGIAEHLLA
jgi:hypothetical protein